MVLEIVSIQILPGRSAAFEAAYRKAERLLPTQEGYEGHEIRESLDSPELYAILIEWRAIEDVTLGFRKTAAFKRWNELLSEFLASGPTNHYFGRPKVIGAITKRST